MKAGNRTCYINANFSKPQETWQSHANRLKLAL